ncbi:MAG: hypothetical protein NC213_00175 [Acetobacter sp.]|nr:hypothetical protein [Bacteroides sp.]MCM1340141.1 hypothetical protein [Acetobacter sp.]MCM1432723.1 hypothetical protein [Clostridiales bacterium]
MRRIKQIGITSLTAIMLFMVFAITAFAASSPFAIQFDKSKINAGNQLSATITVSQETVTNGKLTFTYGDNLELVSAQLSDGREKQGVYASINTKTKGKIIVAFSNNNSSPISTGDLVDVKFKAKADIKGFVTESLKLDADSKNSAVYGTDYKALEISAASSDVTIEGKSVNENNTKKQPDHTSAEISTTKRNKAPVGSSESQTVSQSSSSAADKANNLTQKTVSNKNGSTTKSHSVSNSQSTDAQEENPTALTDDSSNRETTTENSQSVTGENAVESEAKVSIWKYLIPILIALAAAILIWLFIILTKRRKDDDDK